MHNHNHSQEAVAPVNAAPVEPVKAPKAEKIEQNGVTRPGAGTATSRVWDLADAESKKTGAPAKRAEVLKAAEAEGINVTTAATQFGRWCKFHGIKPVPAAPKEKKVKAPKTTEVAPAPVETVPA